MNTRTNKYKNSGKVTNKAIIITICLLIMLAFLCLLFSNDKTVAVDSEAQMMLKKAHSKDENYSFPIPEKRYQEILHMMTHQKVRSKLKYGAVEMSKENIEAMMKILTQNEEVYENAKLYREILVRWKVSNFDEIVGEHNMLNDLLETNDKQALIKMGKLAEDKFISENFGSVD